MRPRVSVVLPVYNGRPFLAEAIASVRAQQWDDLELIAVDDGSTDGSADELRRLAPEAILIQQENRGAAAARNVGVARATGVYLAFLDADDVWPEGKLALQVGRLEADPGLLASCGEMCPFTDVRGPDGAVVRRLAAPYFLFLLGGMVARTAAFREVGLFDEAKFSRFSDDTDWFFRAWERTAKIELCKNVTLLYRQHGASLTAGMNAVQKGMAHVLKASLDRRRAEAAAVRPLPDGFLRTARLATPPP